MDVYSGAISILLLPQMVNPISSSAPFINTSKTAFMQRIADLVRAKHTMYMQGQVDRRRAGALARKFGAMFPTNLDKVAAYRARLHGNATARLLFLYQHPSDMLHWILLYHSGTAPDMSGQTWRDALSDKIVLTGYELVRHTRPGFAQPAWSWRYTHNQLSGLRQDVVNAIRLKNDHQLRQLIDSLVRSPGFALVRKQVASLTALVRAEWLRRRGKAEPIPEIPKHGYTRRVADAGVWLYELDSHIAKHSKAGEASVTLPRPRSSKRNPKRASGKSTSEKTQ